MPITAAQIQAAQQAQHAAAHDLNTRIRLVAGPGTGKSSSIAERVRWLLADQNVPPANLFVVSFTRASARDLRRKIHGHCTAQGHAAGTLVSVTTLHSLALRVLWAAGQLRAYPVDPVVMDDWELKNIFDAEFAQQTGATPTRCKEVRLDHEAFWSTGAWTPTNYVPPDPPITAGERDSFVRFHGPRSQAYAAVLPGEIVRKCVEATVAGVLNPADLVGMTHLVVDEFQDLNPIDQAFVEDLVRGGVVTFIAGDDDQSIYSFRYASPAGIQGFVAQHAGASAHVLAECFRCTPSVVDAATDLIQHHALPNRIPKALNSLYAGSNPPLVGRVHRWCFRTGAAEARAVAESCRDLIAQGTSPHEILVLMSDSDLLEGRISKAFTEVGVPHQLAKDETLTDEEVGRLALAVLRIVCEPNDYVAYRTLLGLMPGVGIGTCHAIAVAVLANNLNFKDLFHRQIPPGVFNRRRLNGLMAARAAVGQLANWLPVDTLAQRGADLGSLLGGVLGPTAAQQWAAATASLPPQLQLEELRDYLWATDPERQAEVLADAFERMGQAVGPPQPPALKVRLMTMHGAKGLGAQVVFIPGLEEEVLPGPHRQPYPGLVLESARLLYVSISRARAACVLTFVNYRWMYTRNRRHNHSRFTTCVGGPFLDKRNGGGGLSVGECAAIVQECLQL